VIFISILKDKKYHYSTVAKNTFLQAAPKVQPTPLTTGSCLAMQHEPRVSLKWSQSGRAYRVLGK
jgi:hypothetical protein